MKLLRGSERDLKLDIVSAQENAANIENKKESKTPNPFMQVEGCRRFMSLCSKRVIQTNNKNNTEITTETNSTGFNNIECPQSRVDFHKTLSMLIRMGFGDKSVQDRSTRRHVSVLV